MYNNRKVIVSMTTIPSRMENAHMTIQGLFKQTADIDEIVLAIPSRSLREEADYELSDQIKELSDSGRITILQSEEDYGPATKLFPVLKREMKKGLSKEKEAIIITVDDDKHYNVAAIDQLLDSAVIESGAVVCRKGSRLYNAAEDHPFRTELNEGILERIYSGGEVDKYTSVDILYGTSGVAYRPSYFSEDVFAYEETNEDFPAVSAFFVDDIFLGGYLSRRNVSVVVVPFEKNAFQEKAPSNVLDGNTVNNTINPISSVSKSQPNLSKDTIKHFADVFNRKV